MPICLYDHRPICEWLVAGVTGGVLVLELGAAVHSRAVGLSDPGHGHVGAVDEEDEDGQQADQGTQHAEADDTAAA